MNIELKIMTTLTKFLPPIRGAGWVANLLKHVYNRRNRDNEITKVFGKMMELNPSECVDGELLFYPHLYDRKERKFLASYLKAGDVFIDIGANIGAYSLFCSSLVGKDGRVISIEADPFNAARLRKNINLNKLDNILVSEIGLSDKNEFLKFYQQMSGNRGGSSFIGSNDLTVIEVSCTTLKSIYEKMEIKECAVLKVDIEGFECKVLKHFFSQCDSAWHPRAIILEVNPMYESSKFLPKILDENRYYLSGDHYLNQIWIKC